MTTKSIFSIFFLLLLASACEEPVDIEIQVEKKLVVNSSFSHNIPWTVFVTKPKHPLDRNTAVENIYGAKVTIYEGNTVIEELVFEDPGILPNDGAYRTTKGTSPKPGSVYSVQVEAKGYPIATATDSVPDSKISISNFQHLDDHTSSDGIFYLEIKDLSISSNDFYQVSFRRNLYSRENQGGTLSLISSDLLPFNINDYEPIFGSESETEGFSMFNQLGFILDDKTMDSNMKRIGLKLDTMEEPDAPNLIYGFQAEVRTISPAYYTYQKSIVDQLAVSQNPLASPLGLYTNILDGYGNFTGYSSLLSEVVFVSE